MAENTKFDLCVNRVLDNEAGYKPASADDPGGETNWGISKAAFPDVDIKNLTRAGAIELYRNHFWGWVRGDDLPAAVAFQLLDFAVNSGPGMAVRALQTVASVARDGMMGPQTIAAIEAMDPAAVLAGLAAERLIFYTRCANWAGNGAGWVRRVAKNLQWGAYDLTATP